MSFPSLIKELCVGSRSLSLYINNQIPYVEFDDQKFNHIWLLSQEFPSLSEPEHIKAFSELSNFLWKGDQFHYIDSIYEYQKFYLERIELEKMHPSDVFPYRLTDYKIFDVSIMHEPLLEEGNLYYFVYKALNGLPYRVVCPFPYISTSTVVHYQILPIKSDVNEKS